MAKRLAITIAGAVSLGSYEAGVMWEVLDAIRQHNANPATKDEERIVVDVATGASAGGMTAVILAQKLLYYGDQFVGPYDNPLYDTWVKQINLVKLQATKPEELATHSLFSSDLIESLAEEILLKRYRELGPVDQKPYGAVDAAKTFRVGVAMTNLDGVDYGYPLRLNQGNFIYREYADQMTRRVLPSVPGKGCDTSEFWTPLREAAVACGAFPVAFRSKDLSRGKGGLDGPDYPAANLEPWPDDPRTFTYSDGGMVQNQPLGMAKNLVDEVDQHLDQENRFYLFVSPHAKEPMPDNYHEANGDYVHLALQLAKVVMGQAGFRDWITAQGVNERVGLMDKRAEGLMKGILDKQVEIIPLQKTATALLEMLFPDGKNTAPGSKAGPEQLWSEEGLSAEKRIELQYHEEMELLLTFDPSGDAGKAFRDSMVAFEAAAGLAARDVMKIYGVTADASQLAGAGVQAFLGFFDEKFRLHDYEVGRDHAQSFLMSLKTINPNAGELGPLRFDFDSSQMPKIDHGLDGLKLLKVQSDFPGDLDGFKGSLKARVDQMLDETISNEAERFGAKVVVRGIVDGLLKLLVRTQ